VLVRGYAHLCPSGLRPNGLAPVKLRLTTRLRRLWCALTSHAWRITVCDRRHSAGLSWDYSERTCRTCGRVEYWSAARTEWNWGGKFTKERSQ